MFPGCSPPACEHAAFGWPLGRVPSSAWRSPHQHILFRPYAGAAYRGRQYPRPPALGSGSGPDRLDAEHFFGAFEQLRRADRLQFAEKIFGASLSFNCGDRGWTSDKDALQQFENCFPPLRRSAHLDKGYVKYPRTHCKCRKEKKIGR